jgi:hypothetical protein
MWSALGNLASGLDTKIFVSQAVYETLLYILAPFALPMSFIINLTLTEIIMAVTTALYLVNAIMFNKIHLRLKRGESNMELYCILHVAQIYTHLCEHPKFPFVRDSGLDFARELISFR